MAEEASIRDIRPQWWHDASSEVEQVTFLLEIGKYRGTAFLASVGQDSKQPDIHGLMFVTAWHVMKKEFDTRPDVRLTSADRSAVFDNHDHTIEIYRLGSEELDTGLVIVYLDDLPFDEDPMRPMLLPGQRLVRGAEIGWLGFPGVAGEELCFFRGSVAGHTPDFDRYFVDGVAMSGVSGGPAFNNQGVIIGLVSSYLPGRVGGGTGEELHLLPGLCLLVPIEYVVRMMDQLLSARMVRTTPLTPGTVQQIEPEPPDRD